MTQDEDLAEVIGEFLVESGEGLDALDQAFVELEHDPTDAGNLAFVFRTIHSIKGASGFLGFQNLEKVTHSAENLLSQLRDATLLLTPEITTVLLLAVDAVRQMLLNIEQSGADGDADHSELIRSMEALSHRPESRSESKVLNHKEAVFAPQAGEAQAVSDDSNREVTSSDDENKSVGELLVEAGKANPEEVQAALAAQLAGDPRHVGEILVERGVLDSSEVVEALNTQRKEAGPAVNNSTIRIDVALIDRLMNLVGELVLARNQVLQFTANQPDSALVETTQRLNLITTELQAGVMKTRMQPIGNVWSKFPRVVRDLSLSVGKKVKLYMEGAETELDKTIIEAVKDPLTHLVRNAIDHGIETPEARAAAGKPVDGTLSLRAFHEGGHVNIEISDDGSGIDSERIKAKAISSGLISAEQAAKLSERDASALIFLPGLTTAAAVTNISGRGVGMDVVKTNIEKIGGVMDIHSVKGVGTTFRIKIPLTLAIIPALIVTTAENRYLIPQVNLVELVRLEADQALSSIEKIHNAPVVRLRDRLLPLVDLADILKTPKKTKISSTDEGEAEVDPRLMPINIVVLQADDNQFGLIVDEVLDTEEIVVKPMGRQIKNIPAFAGATIMGDGRVALIIDVMGLAQESGVIAQGRARSAGEAHSTAVEESVSTQPMLVLGVGSTSRAAIPLSAVDRLEEFARDIIETTGGKDVVQYRGSILPLAYVSQILNLPSSSDDAEILEVVVHTSKGASVGIVCDSIVDIIDESINLQATDSRPGVTGVAVIDGRVTDVLDVEFIANTVRLSGSGRSRAYVAVAS